MNVLLYIWLATAGGGYWDFVGSFHSAATCHYIGERMATRHQCVDAQTGKAAK